MKYLRTIGIVLFIAFLLGFLAFLLVSRQISEGTKILGAAFFGGCAAGFVQWLSLSWQEQTQRKLLRISLYRELAGIYIDLRELADHLSPSRSGPNRADLSKFVAAPCFETAKSVAGFWRLSDAFGIVEAHRKFSYLALLSPTVESEEVEEVRSVLEGFRRMFGKPARLCRNEFLKAACGKVMGKELAGND